MIARDSARIGIGSDVTDFWPWLAVLGGTRVVGRLAVVWEEQGAATAYCAVRGEEYAAGGRHREGRTRSMLSRLNPLGVW